MEDVSAALESPLVILFFYLGSEKPVKTDGNHDMGPRGILSDVEESMARGSPNYSKDRPKEFSA